MANPGYVHLSDAELDDTPSKPSPTPASRSMKALKLLGGLLGIYDVYQLITDPDWEDKALAAGSLGLTFVPGLNVVSKGKKNS